MQISPAIAQRLGRDLPGRQGSMPQQGPRRGQREGAARSDGGDAVVGLDHVAGARDHEDAAGIADHEHGLEAAEHAVAAPVARQLHRGTPHVAGKGFELGFEPLGEGQRVGRAAGEAHQRLAVRHPAHLLGSLLHDGVPDGDLSVGGHGEGAVAQHRQHRRGANRRRLAHPASPRRFGSRARGWAAS